MSKTEEENEQAQLIEKLKSFKAAIATYKSSQTKAQRESFRSQINEMLFEVVELVKNAGCHEYVVVQEPASIGGRRARVDPFANIFNDPFFNDVTSNVIDSIDQTIGVIKSGKYEQVKDNLHRPEPRVGPVSSKKVFLVHGHNDALVEEAKSTLMTLGLEPIVLREEPNKGRTVIEKFEDHTEVAFAVVLMTQDDEGKAKAEKDYQPRARQNVLFELGYFCARLTRSRVVALVEKGLEIPSDLAGVIVLHTANPWKYELAKELRAAGLDADSNKL